MKIRQVEAELFHTDRQTDMTKITVAFLRYFKRSYIWCVVLSTVLTGYANELGTNATCIWYIRVKPIQSRLTSWLKVGSQPYRTCFFVMQANLKLQIKRHSFTSHIHVCRNTFNPLNPELNPICYLLALLGAHYFLHVSRITVKSLTLRRLMSYIYGAPILDVSRSHTTTQHSR